MFFTCHSFNNTHIIMTAKFTHYDGQIIYIYILWCNTPYWGFHVEVLGRNYQNFQLWLFHVIFMPMSWPFTFFFFFLSNVINEQIGHKGNCMME
jgi:hypothetical protein